MDIGSDSNQSKGAKEDEDSSSSDNNLGCDTKENYYNGIMSQCHKGSVCTPNANHSIEFEKINMRKMSSPICAYYNSTQKFLEEMIDKESSTLKNYDYTKSNNYINKEKINNNYYSFTPKNLFYSENYGNMNMGYCPYEMNNNIAYEGYLSFKDHFSLNPCMAADFKDSSNRNFEFVHKDNSLNSNLAQADGILRSKNMNNFNVNKPEEDNINNINNNQAPSFVYPTVWRLNSMPTNENPLRFNLMDTPSYHKSSSNVLVTSEINKDKSETETSSTKANANPENSSSNKDIPMTNILNLRNKNVYMPNRSILRAMDSNQMNYYAGNYVHSQQNYDRRRIKQFARREGDWICPACKNLNFAFRVVCNRCKLAKGEAEKSSMVSNQSIQNPSMDNKDNQTK